MRDNTLCVSRSGEPDKPTAGKDCGRIGQEMEIFDSFRHIEAALYEIGTSTERRLIDAI